MLRQTSSLITIFIAIAFLWLVTNCSKVNEKKKTPEVPPVPESVPQSEISEFVITEPVDRAKVDRNVITVKGTGALEGTLIVVEVFTDQWYLQDGRYEIEKDGRWTYSPCFLKGKGAFKFHHNIRAKLLKNGQVLATSTVYDIAAPAP